MLTNFKLLFLFMYVCVCLYKCIWLIPDYVFLFPSEFRDLAVRRVTRRIKKNRVYIIVPPSYIRVAGSDNRTLTHRRPSTIFYLNRLKFLRS